MYPYLCTFINKLITCFKGVVSLPQIYPRLRAVVSKRLPVAYACSVPYGNISNNPEIV